jgi:hypothetical protein
VIDDVQDFSVHTAQVWLLLYLREMNLPLKMPMYCKGLSVGIIKGSLAVRRLTEALNTGSLVGSPAEGTSNVLATTCETAASTRGIEAARLQHQLWSLSLSRTFGDYFTIPWGEPGGRLPVGLS